MRLGKLGVIYLIIAVILAAFVALLAAVVQTAPQRVAAAALIRPVVALVVLTAVVAVMMVVYRNLAVIRGAATLRYFQTFVDKPAEWVERPARAYMNLLELPVLFYVVCLLMLATGRFDSVQVALMWIFVVTRCVHAFIHIGFNYVPLRFTAFLSGALALAAIWTRFAAQALSAA